MVSLLLNLFNNLFLPIWVFVAAAAIARNAGRWGEISLYRAFMTLSCLLYLVVLCGVKVGYIAWLLKLTLPLAFAVLAWKLLSGRSRPDPVTTLFLIALIPLNIMVLFTPLFLCDTRSIWFFHAKMIYFFGRLAAESGLGDPALVGSHLDYPNLLPSLAALASSLAGFWNEYVPKAALTVLLTGFGIGIARLGLLSTIAKGLVIVAMLPVYYLGDLFYSGMMDGYLMAFALLGQLYMLDYYHTGKIESLKSGLITILLLPSLKNEGIVLAGVSLFVFASFHLILFRRIAPMEKTLRHCLSVGALAAIANIALWTLLKTYWNIGTEYRLSDPAFLQRAMERFTPAVMKMIFLPLIYQSGIGLLILIFMATLALALIRNQSGRTFSPDPATLCCLAPFASAILYTGVLFLIYLSTPYGLDWHLASSLPRVALPVLAFLAVAIHENCYVIAQWIGDKFQLI